MPACRRRPTGISKRSPSRRPGASCARAASRPRTILCANDRVAFGVLAAMYARPGIKVGFEPDCQFRVAGHDNQRFSAYTCPPLTTVSQDCDEMGRVALQHAVCQHRGRQCRPTARKRAQVLLERRAGAAPVGLRRVGGLALLADHQPHDLVAARLVRHCARRHSRHGGRRRCGRRPRICRADCAR